MSSSVLVVIIVGGIIAVISYLTVKDEAKPATPHPATQREAEDPAPTRPEDERIPAFPVVESPAITPAEGPQHLADEPLERLAPSWRQRLRAAGLLGVSVVVLGSLAAGAVGAVLYLGLRVLERALE